MLFPNTSNVYLATFELEDCGISHYPIVAFDINPHNDVVMPVTFLSKLPALFAYTYCHDKFNYYYFNDGYECIGAYEAEQYARSLTPTKVDPS
jgi:hypothetical protein